MAAPTISVRTIAALLGTPNLTTLTGGRMSNDSIQGYTGAAWVMTVHFSKMKYGSGEQMVMNTFGTVTGVGIYSWPITITYSDDEQDLSGTYFESRTFDFGTGTSCGIYYSPFADQKLRTFRWYGKLTGGGYSVTATLSDGSVTPRTLALPTNTGEFGIEIVYRAKTAGTIDIRITKTGSSTGTIWPMVAYIPVPTPPARPNGLSVGITP